MKIPSTLPLRQRLITIAQVEVGVVESPKNSNRGKRVGEYQRATNLEGTGWPYCAAFVCWCIREWIKDGEVRAALGLKTVADAEAWRPKTAAAFGFHEWAASKKLLIMDDSPDHVLHTGDVMTFDMSHVGIVTDDFVKGGKSYVRTIEGNTGNTDGNDGGGVFAKIRNRSEARKFIRILA